MHRHLIAAAAAAVLVAVLGPADPASADASGYGFTDRDGIGAGATQTGGPTRGTPWHGGSSLAVRCEYARLNEEDATSIGRYSAAGFWQPHGTESGAWYRKICSDAGGVWTATVTWIADRPDPVQLAASALDRVPVPAPAMQLNPAADQTQVVNVETWLSIDSSQWKPVSATASAGGVTVTTTASPERVVWTMGNGDKVMCTGPGIRYDSSRPSSNQHTDCGYTYRRSSAGAPDGRYQMSATVDWSVRWSAVGAAGGGALGPISRTATVPVRVAEIQAVNR